MMKLRQPKTAALLTALVVVAFAIAGCAAEPEPKPFVPDPEIQQIVADAMETADANEAARMATLTPTPTPTSTDAKPASSSDVDLQVEVAEKPYAGYTYDLSVSWSNLDGANVEVSPATELGQSQIDWTVSTYVQITNTTPERELPLSAYVSVLAQYEEASPICSLNDAQSLEALSGGGCLYFLGQAHLSEASPAPKLAPSASSSVSGISSPTVDQLGIRVITVPDADVDAVLADFIAPVDYVIAVSGPLAADTCGPDVPPIGQKGSLVGTLSGAIPCA